jgi:hypothetical protein
MEIHDECPIVLPTSEKTVGYISAKSRSWDSVLSDKDLCTFLSFALTGLRCKKIKMPRALIYAPHYFLRVFAHTLPLLQQNIMNYVKFRLSILGAGGCQCNDDIKQFPQVNHTWRSCTLAPGPVSQYASRLLGGSNWNY